MGSLTPTGHVWAFLSVGAAVLCCSGCYLPYWIQGKLLGRVDASFNSFRRCNFPRSSPQGTVDIVIQCARYSRWKDIPSVWWQASTVLVAVGCVLSIIVAVVATSACCLDHVIHTTTAKLAGYMQLLASLVVSGGVAIYPLGLDNREVRDCCGPGAHAFSLGNCRVSYSVYLVVAALLLLLVCFSLNPMIARS
ncbi:LHFPL tetraspan subfamily member 6 protein-like [Macrosteles quadrilineatus]|uniref:LHFPL tetraspan subfamily member 6 protein-like n=1 Tax=Macrosteles quadrilineatus TaxID=74068 RepID=UPI0023E2F67D|nr:LHFPL tetraspan subfamily member 6 protein-like [Macrosteles quadrilineatus]